jgi:uncharacterized protein (UPF0303 family)
MDSTKRFTSLQLLAQERTLTLPYLTMSGFIEIGDIAKTLGLKNNLKVAIEVRNYDWIVYHVNLPGSNPENDFWINRKARVVNLKRHSTLYERINAEERNIDWYVENNLNVSEYAIHGGGFPLRTRTEGFIGSLLISGLPQVEDHLFGVEVLKQYLTQIG